MMTSSVVVKYNTIAHVAVVAYCLHIRPSVLHRLLTRQYDIYHTLSSVLGYSGNRLGGVYSLAQVDSYLTVVIIGAWVVDPKPVACARVRHPPRYNHRLTKF